MDGCSGKRNRSGIVVPKKGCSLAVRDSADTKDQNAQFCNRIGCSGRLKYSKSSPLHCTEKPRYSRLSIRSSNGKEIAGTSSRTCYPITNGKNSPQDSPRKFSSCLDPPPSKSRGVVQGDSHMAKIHTTGKNHQTQLQHKMRTSSTGKASLTEVGTSGAGSTDTSKKVYRHKSHSGFQNVLISSTISSTDSIIRSTTRNCGSGSHNSLRNLKCNSISDVIPRGGGSSSGSKNRRDLLKKNTPEGESSSSFRGKRGNVTPSDEHVFPSNSGVSNSSSRHNRNWASNNNSNASSVMRRRSVNANTKITRSNHNSITALQVTGLQSMIPQSARSEMHNNANHASPYLSSSGASSSASSSCTPEQFGDDVPRIATLTSTERGITQGFRRHNLNGAAEVLLALERIEQDEELTYEQLLVLENNLFLGNLYFYDQHRDMRLDIDNMSYEELLALEDRMGTVSTALSEEAFAKCVKRTIHQAACLEVRVGGCCEDEADAKCSICQEEYAIGDEIGRLECEHGYHMTCLQQWLRLKNWCPICKTSAAP